MKRADEKFLHFRRTASETKPPDGTRDRWQNTEMHLKEKCACGLDLFSQDYNMWRTRLRPVGFLKRRGIMWLVKRLTDFRVGLQALSQCISFLVWTAIYRPRSSCPLKRIVLFYVSLLFHWYRGSLEGVKRPERDVHSPPSGDEVKNACNHTSTPSICPLGTNGDFLFTFYPRLSIWMFCALSAVRPHTLSRFIFKTVLFNL